MGEALHDWCITRTLDWGVKFPGRDDLVVTSGADAPIGYISFTKGGHRRRNHWKDYWCGDDTRVTHFISGDIVYHHCIFWPALLKGAGYGLPARWSRAAWSRSRRKFSKSRGYVVWTNDDYLDVASRRTTSATTSSPTQTTRRIRLLLEGLRRAVNNEIVGTLGNSSTGRCKLAEKEFAGVPDLPPAGGDQEIERSLAGIDGLMRTTTSRTPSMR